MSLMRTGEGWNTRVFSITLRIGMFPGGVNVIYQGAMIGGYLCGTLSKGECEHHRHVCREQ